MCPRSSPWGRCRSSCPFCSSRASYRTALARVSRRRLSRVIPARSQSDATRKGHYGPPSFDRLQLHVDAIGKQPVPGTGNYVDSPEDKPARQQDVCRRRSRQDRANGQGGSLVALSQMVRRSSLFRFSVRVQGVVHVVPSGLTTDRSDYLLQG